MRRGITPVVAIALLLGMTVTASGGAYTFISSTTGQAQERTDTSLQTSISFPDVQCGGGRADVWIRNSGDTSLSATSADAYLFESGDLAANATIDISDRAFTEPDGMEAVHINFTEPMAGSTRYELEIRIGDTTATTQCRTQSQQSCAALTAFGFERSGRYYIDPDGNGGNAPFEAYCDMDTRGGGWTLVGIFSNDDTNRWNWSADVWRNGSTFGSVDSIAFSSDYKSNAFSTVPVQDVMIEWEAEGKQAATDCFDGQDSLAGYFDSIWSTAYLEDTAGSPGYHTVCEMALNETSTTQYTSQIGGLGFAVRDERNGGDRTMVGYWYNGDHYQTGLGDRDETGAWRDTGIDHAEADNARLYVR